MTVFRGFPPDALTFLRALKKNNRREWFEPQKPRFQASVVSPFKALAEELDVRFARLAPEFVGDPKRSLFRIYRDVRFSKDKSPYKTHAAMWIYHRAPGRGVGKEVDGGAGFYVHLEPGANMIAAGLWMPPRHLLNKVRAQLADDHKAFAKLVTAAPFTKRFGGLTDDEPGVLLKRMPRGYDESHPAAAWLRYNSFTASVAYTDAQMLAPKVADAIMKDFALLLPMTRWLNRALGFLPATSR